MSNSNFQTAETVRCFHRRMPGYAPTPLRTLPAFGHGDLTVLVKDESNRLGLPAFKILGASWAVYRKIESALGITLNDWKTFDNLARLVEPLRPRTLIAATDGNHGRAVARMAKLLGFNSRIFIPKGTVAARLDGIASEGAEVVVVDGTFDEAVIHAADAASDDGTWLILDTSTHGDENIARWVIEGYATMMQEIDDEIARAGHAPPNIVFVQIGVGALAAAVVRHFRPAGGAGTDAVGRVGTDVAGRAGVPPAVQVGDLHHRAPVIIGVEAKCAACAHESAAKGELVVVPGPHDSIMAGLNCGTLSGVAWPEIRDGIDHFLAIEDKFPRLAMQRAAEHGIVMGESGAAGLAALIDLMENPDRTDLRERLALHEVSSALVIDTEGATDPASYKRIVRRGHGDAHISRAASS